jgi:zinc transport system ATP-binding protein
MKPSPERSTDSGLRARDAITDPTVVQVTDGALALSGRPILRGIDLSLRRGQVVAMLGSNGSGKSTLVRGLLGLTPWTTGDVRLFGIPLSEFRQWERIGYVPQLMTATSGVPATVQEVVSSGRLSRRRLLMPMSGKDRTAVREALRAVELDDRRSDSVSQLSGGQQHRVLIARALAGQPDLFVLDEPTAGVDHASQLNLVDTLRPRVQAGATVLLVLHELGPLGELIDRAVLLRDGRIAYDGPPPDDGSLHEFNVHHHARPVTDTVPLRTGWDL